MQGSWGGCLALAKYTGWRAPSGAAVSGLPQACRPQINWESEVSRSGLKRRSMTISGNGHNKSQSVIQGCNVRWGRNCNWGCYQIRTSYLMNKWVTGNKLGSPPPWGWVSLSAVTNNQWPSQYCHWSLLGITYGNNQMEHRQREYTGVWAHTAALH